jgi:N-acylglucosamine 2-epimerase
MDSEGKPALGLDSDQKLWWCHNEAMIALLYACKLKGGDDFAGWYTKVHNYAFNLFPDREYGEWLGYFHRDGRMNLRVKGSNWKCCFHLPRHLLTGWKLLRELESRP